MLPVQYFLAATGASLALYLLKNRFVLLVYNFYERIIHVNILTQILIISLFNFYTGLNRFVQFIQIDILLWDRITIVIAAVLVYWYVIGLFFIIIKRKSLVHVKEYSVLVITGILRFSIAYFNQTPSYNFYRYNGIFDILLILSWLYFFKSFLKDEVNANLSNL